MLQKILLIFLLYGISLSSSYRILAIFPFNGKSHPGVLLPIAQELALKGHRVDVISSFPLKEPIPNYTDIIVLPKGSSPSMNYNVITSLYEEEKWLFDTKSRICNYLELPEISKLIKSPPTNPPYDLLLVHILVGWQCFSAIGHVWNIPVAGVVTTTLYAQMDRFIGNPSNLAISPKNLVFYKEEMNFWDRLYNVVKTHYNIRLYYNNAKNQDHFIQKYFGVKVPSYQELERNYALILSNSHYTLHGVRPKTPALIEIGGINIKNETSVLSLDLKKFLDESKHGFIYFSFGSLIAIESIPPQVLRKLYTAMRKISPVRIVMKVSNYDAMPKGMPDNVFTYTWLPQQNILGHPNIKAFVTHGGALSTQEAITYIVPLICIPFFAEQNVNCDIMTIKNAALKLDIKKAQQHDYDYVFQEMLSNPVYKESMRKFSALYWDRPQSPKETSVYWLEYVIRHGKNVLKSPAIDLKWWQNELLDIYAFLFACIILIFLVLTIVARLILTFFIRTIYPKKYANLSKNRN